MVLCSLFSLQKHYFLLSFSFNIFSEPHTFFETQYFFNPIFLIEIDLRIAVVVEHLQGTESRPLKTNKITLYGEDTLEEAVTDLDGMLRKVNPPEASWNWMLHLFLLVTFFC